MPLHTADTFRDWMDENDLSPSDLTELLGKSEQTLYHWRSNGVPKGNRDFVTAFIRRWREKAPSPEVSDEAVTTFLEETQNLVLKPTPEQFDAWTAAFKTSKAATLHEWAMEGLSQMAREEPVEDTSPAPHPLPIPERNVVPMRDSEFWINLRGGVAAGSPIDSVVEEAIPVNKDYPEDHYALRVFGGSMEPRIPDGSTIVVQGWSERGFPGKGKIVVYSDGMGATLKEFGYRKAQGDEEGNAFGQVPVLRSLNKAFPDVQTMDGGKIDAVLVEIL